MPTEVFSIETFTESLPRNKTTGKGLFTQINIPRFTEVVFAAEVKPEILLLVASSIRIGNTHCDGTGKNSIRAWLVDSVDLTPVAGKHQEWIARTKNWRDNLSKVLRQLWKDGLLLGTCPACNRSTLHLFTVKKEGPHKGERFLGCPDDNCRWRKWEGGEVWARR